MVTFELFVAPAVDLLSGAEAREMPVVVARLGEALYEKLGVTHFLPAHMEGQGAGREVKVLKWQGSGDVSALSKANCFVIVPATLEKIGVGERVEVMVRRDLI
jgi:molybdopterin molybdotransferase